MRPIAGRSPSAYGCRLPNGAAFHGSGDIVPIRLALYIRQYGLVNKFLKNEIRISLFYF